MSKIIGNTAWAKPVREAAARVYGCDPESIHIELEEQHLDLEGRKTVLINFNESLKAAPEVRKRVKEAVAAVLPDNYRDYRVTIT